MKLKYLNIAILILTIAALFFELSRCSTAAGLVPGYPAWLVDGEKYPQQTSGITFIKNDELGQPVFIICDDKQALHYLKVVDDEFTLTSIEIDSSVTDTIPSKTKLDMEDIAYDKYTNKVYISIEPEKRYRQQFGIYELVFKDNDIFSGRVTGLKRLVITPDSLFHQYIEDNTGYEGLAVDSNCLYLGLEGIKRGETSFDGSIIRVVDKRTLKIVATMLLDSLGVNTITGLAMADDGTLWGVDRNRLNFFNLKFDNKFTVTNIRVFNITNYIPGYHQYRYAAAIEGISLDKTGFVYLIDDPFTKEYVPVENILRKMDKKTEKRFKELVPIIYKYKME